MCKKKVLFICRNNSGRSQLAESLLEKNYGEHYDVYSAGYDPKDINPLTIKVLNEIGIDTSQKRSKSLNEFQGYEFDYVVSLCGDEEEVCPIFINGKNYIHKGFRDPRKFSGEDDAKLKGFRTILNEIKEWVHDEFKITE